MSVGGATKKWAIDTLFHSLRELGPTRPFAPAVLHLFFFLSVSPHSCLAISGYCVYTTHIERGKKNEKERETHMHTTRAKKAASVWPSKISPSLFVLGPNCLKKQPFLPSSPLYSFLLLFKEIIKIFNRI